MLKKILSLFTGHKAAETNATEQTDKKKMDITPFIKDIEEILKVECPKIQSVACLYESYSPEYGQNMVMGLREFHREDIPEDAAYKAAYYMDDKDIILIARKYADPDFDTGEMHFKNLTSAEHLFHIAHELRHVWQKKYASDIYYKTNAINMECINDVSEIDADAFAFSYVFSDRTPFTYEDIPTISEEIVLQATADNGKRWKRTEELIKEFDFNSNEKLEVLKSHIDTDKINFLVGMMKINRMI